MKKRLFSFVLILCLICSLLPCAAFAAQVKHFHPRISFETPISDVFPQNAEGSYYLTGNIKAQGDILIDKEVSLCLAGFCLDMGEYSIKISSEGALSIYDCIELATGSIRSDHSSDNAVIENHGSLVILDGNMQADKRVMILNKYETSVAGGKFTGETDLLHTIGTAVLNVTGGQFEAKKTASAICMISDPIDETAKKRDYNAGIGGAAKITAEAESQGAVLVNAPKGRFVINTGADIRGIGCPGITVLAGTFDAYGAAAVSSDTNSAIVGRGGTVALYNAVINSDEKYGVDMVEDGNLHLSGALDINGGLAGIHLSEGKLFSMSDYGFYGDVRISMLTDVVPEEGKNVAISMPCDVKHSPHFISANPGCTIKYENGSIYNVYDGSVSHFHDGRNYILNFDGTLNDLSKNNYYLQNDVSCSGFFTGSVVNLCLNGHTLRLSSAIKLYPNSTLNIFDCTGGGRIETNSTCIQDINDGNVKLVLHDGLIVSHGSVPVKLSGGDTIVVKGGEIKSELDGSCAIEVLGAGNRVESNGGIISGAAVGINAKDTDFTLAGNGEGSIAGGNYAVDMAGMKPAVLSLDGSAKLEGGTADICLGSNKLLMPISGLAPAEPYSILNVDENAPILGLPSEIDASMYFTSTIEDKIVVANENNELILAKSLPVSPMETELYSGDSVTLAVEYSGDAVPSFQWYVRRGESGNAQPIEGATAAEYTSPANLESGAYSYYCVINDGSAVYYTDNAFVDVLRDHIVNVSVLLSSPLTYNGTARAPMIESSASTTLGKPVSFSYSADGINFAPTPPSFGPDAGDYTLHYIASADGCDDVKGEITISISPAAVEEAKPSPKAPGLNLNFDLDMDARLLALVVLLAVVVLLSIIYTVIQLRKLTKKDNN